MKYYRSLAILLLGLGMLLSIGCTSLGQTVVDENGNKLGTVTYNSALVGISRSGTVIGVQGNACEGECPHRVLWAGVHGNVIKDAVVPWGSAAIQGHFLERAYAALRPDENTYTFDVSADGGEATGGAATATQEQVAEGGTATATNKTDVAVKTDVTSTSTSNAANTTKVSNAGTNTLTGKTGGSKPKARTVAAKKTRPVVAQQKRRNVAVGRLPQQRPAARPTKRPMVKRAPQKLFKPRVGYMGNFAS